MPHLEPLTVSLPGDLLEALEGAVAGGDYATSSEVVQEALRDWKHKRAAESEQSVILETEIARGLADMAVGRVQDFDPARIIRRGRTLLAARSRSA